MRRSLVPLAVLGLLGCSSGPPTLETEATWVFGECGEDPRIQLEVHSQPGGKLTIGEPADANRVETVLGPDGRYVATYSKDEFEPLSVSVYTSGAPAMESVYGPSGAIHNEPRESGRSKTQVFSNRCLVTTRGAPGCSITLDQGALMLSGAPPGGTLRHGEVEVTVEEGSDLPTIPLSLDQIASWDLTVFDQAHACPHLVIPDITARSDGRTFHGEVWVSRDSASASIARTLGASLPDAPWSHPPTGDATLITRRFSESAPDQFEAFEGKVGRMSDIRYVARWTRISEDAGSCGMYREDRTGNRVEVRRRRINYHAALYDRLTGQLIDEQTLQGRRGACATITLSGAATGDPPTDKALAWTRSALATHRGG